MGALIRARRLLTASNQFGVTRLVVDHYILEVSMDGIHRINIHDEGVLTTELSLPKDSIETSVILKFMSLIDSGSTDSFIDSTYVLRNDILTKEISLINL